MIEHVLPRPVVVAEHFGDTPDEGLFPEERALMAGVGAGRRREFTTVRHCARLALRELGVAPAPLLPDAEGAPRWPAGTVGSMTHCRGYRAAVAARRAEVRALGIDAEPHRPLREGVLASVALPEERAHQAALVRLDAAIRWDRLLFCAKEATFKAWFPGNARAGPVRPSSLHDIHVILRPAVPDRHRNGGTFHAQVLPGRPGATAFQGHWLATENFLLTAVAVPAPPPGRL
ncbi:4'-phosphopantetheinyl transferase family protein [Streptomyces violascens]|uniref:4'-phosphopantetheinyl transferase n=1 Tax=Streptomyces violascens TaxID=67381 RepID=A0ABQ3QLE9_9ACTN|nr:4'-phosphopantetheinyl transferase superfamily protein [Streptomyces violascens]GGU09282.1 4'-phosphopantetheinyl transferase [Streptomyces violascens]GHI38097.1 4'-phosphopantetheinyl transferase [Streptomyces violascens]